MAAALAANNCAFEEIAYEFITQAFVIYEDSITDSKQQFRCLQLIAGAIQQTRCFSDSNYEAIITKTALHASRLLLKPDQCRAIYTVSHLFWTPSVCFSFCFLFIISHAHFAQIVTVQRRKESS